MCRAKQRSTEAGDGAGFSLAAVDLFLRSILDRWESMIGMDYEIEASIKITVDYISDSLPMSS